MELENLREEGSFCGAFEERGFPRPPPPPTGFLVKGCGADLFLWEIWPQGRGRLLYV